MCGIFGIFQPEGITSQQLQNSLSAIRTLKHRGPDGEGVVAIQSATGEFTRIKTDHTPEGVAYDILPTDFQSGKYQILLCHRRLSIIDLSIQGHQPFTDNEGNIIIFNGEVYNYPDLQVELNHAGIKFRTHCDTEVFLEAWKMWGQKSFSKFNGMWSIVIWDNRKKQLIISNDRFGVKPLYLFPLGKGFLFTSEIKAFLQFPQFDKTLDTSTIHTFLDRATLDHNTNTFFKYVSRFPAACYSIIDPYKDSFPNPDSFWNLDEKRKFSHSYEEATEKLRELFFDAVKIRQRADVEWAVSLSGGLDSSSIAYAAAAGKNNSPGFRTFSCVFPGKEGDESAFIDFIEKDLSLKGVHIHPMEEFSTQQFEQHIWHQDFPVTSTSYFAEWRLMNAVNRAGVKVLLDGQGADEILGGYHHHFFKYLMQLLLKGKISLYKEEIRKYSELKEIPEKQLKEIAMGESKMLMKKFFSGKVPPPIRDYAPSVSVHPVLKQDFFQFLLPTYLRSEDRDSMAFSVETRNPFLDYRLVEFAFSLPTKFKIKEGWQKAILRDAIHEMPEEIRYRKDKKGYSTPQNEWITRYIDEFIGYLDTVPVHELGLSIDIDIIRKKLIKGDALFEFRLSTLGCWSKLFLQNPSDELV